VAAIISGENTFTTKWSSVLTIFTFIVPFGDSIKISKQLDSSNFTEIIFFAASPEGSIHNSFLLLKIQDFSLQGSVEASLLSLQILSGIFFIPLSIIGIAFIIEGFRSKISHPNAKRIIFYDINLISVTFGCICK
jgi:hypothetical protein